MKPFNLEEYLKNPLREIVTRDGKKVKIHCTNYWKYNNEKPLIIAEVEGIGFSESFNEDGTYYNTFESKKDLFFAPKKYEGWIHIFRDSGKDINIMGRYTSNPYDSEEKAIAIGRTTKSYVATIKIEWEVDE